QRPGGGVSAWWLRPDRQPDLVVAALLMAVAVAVFSGSTSGGFVYDDRSQILLNPLVREPGMVWKAMTSDVWAFRAPGEEAAKAGSDFWRPVFVLALIVQARLFGVQDAALWHWALVLLHGAVAAAAFGALRRLSMERPLAAAVGLVFAVHPAHAESVAW